MTVIFWIAFAVIACAVCSILESVLLSIRIPELISLSKRGNRGAEWLLQIKRERVGDAISAILIVNTVASTVGPGFAGASAARIWGDTAVGIISAGLTFLMLVFSEIAPKSYAATHPKTLAGACGITLHFGMWLLKPALVVTRAVTHLMAADSTGGLTRKQLAAIVSSAPAEGAISTAESELLANMIYIRTVTLETVRTPVDLVFSMEQSEPISNLLASAQADAFGRIPVYGGSRTHFTGFVDHRKVLKALATGTSPESPLSEYIEPFLVLRDDMIVLAATRRLLDAHQSLALVEDKNRQPIGIVSVEDLLEAILGIDITDEADEIADLRRAATIARRERTQHIRKARREWEDGQDMEQNQ